MVTSVVATESEGEMRKRVERKKEAKKNTRGMLPREYTNGLSGPVLLIRYISLPMPISCFEPESCDRGLGSLGPGVIWM